jgi:hypothetical protein
MTKIFDRRVPGAWKRPMAFGDDASLSFKVVTNLYRVVPPLRYWGLRRGYLKRTGWIKSGWDGVPVDADGQALPWYTYPAIAFLEGRVRPTMNVFEYGSGQSTHWWARNAGSVNAVEDDPAWFDLISTELPPNVDLQFAQSEDEYANSIATRGTRFDVVVIDGSVRNLCAKSCVEYLAPDGVIVWDNSEMPAMFDEGLDFLRELGFQRLDFHGLGPLNMDPWATSVLYRPSTNSFQI